VITMDKALLIGVLLLGSGSVAAVHHASRALGNDSSAIKHVPWIVAGLVAFNIGSNLVADHIHDRYTGVSR